MHCVYSTVVGGGTLTKPVLSVNSTVYIYAKEMFEAHCSYQGHYRIKPLPAHCTVHSPDVVLWEEAFICRYVWFFSSVMDYFVTLFFSWRWICSVLSKCSARLCFSANLLGLSKEKNSIYHWLGRYTCMSYIYSILFYYILVAQKERKRKHIILLVSSMFLKGTVSWFNFFGKLANINHWLGI